jgi:hypothetical protein
MRIARNLWQYGVPYFNVLEPVMASTAPAWSIVTAPFALFGSCQPLVVALFNAALSVAVAALSVVLGRLLYAPKGRRGIDSALIFFCSYGAILPASLGLMETPLAVACVLLSVIKAVQRQWWWPIPGVLSLFLRPEATVFFVAIALYSAWINPRSLLSSVTIASITALPFILFQLYFFGSLVPHTALAKRIVYDISVSQSFSSFTSAVTGEAAAQSDGIICLLAIAAAILFLIWGKSSSIPADWPTRGALATPGIIILAAYLSQRVLFFTWYAPLVTVPLIMAFVPSPRGVSGMLISFACLFPLLFNLGVTAVALTALQYSPHYPSGLRAHVLGEIGARIKECAAGQSILAPEIGALGYRFEGHIIDGVGLATPRALAFHPLKVPEQRPNGALGGVPAAFAELEKPGFIIGLPSLLSDVVQSSVHSGYVIYTIPLQLKNIAPSKVWGNDSVTVMVRSNFESCNMQLQGLVAGEFR